MSTITKSDLKHSTTLDIPFGQLHHVIEWCQNQLEQDWQFRVIEDADHYSSGLYLFMFESDKDLMKFALWKK